MRTALCTCVHQPVFHLLFTTGFWCTSCFGLQHNATILWKRWKKCEIFNLMLGFFLFVFSQSHHQQTNGSWITGWTKWIRIKCHQPLPWTAISHPPKATRKRDGIRARGAGTLIKADPRIWFLLRRGEIRNPPRRARRAVAAGRNHLPRATARRRGGL